MELKFNAQIKTVKKGDGAPEVTIKLTGSTATHIAAKLMDYTPTGGEFVFTPAQGELEVDDDNAPEVEVHEGQQQIVSEPTPAPEPDDEAAVDDEEPEADAEGAPVEPVGEDADVPFLPEEGEVATAEDIEDALADEAFGGDTEFLPETEATDMIESVIAGGKKNPVSVEFEGVTYSLETENDDPGKGMLTLEITDAPSEDWAIGAATRFFAPVASGQLQMSKDKRIFRITKAAWNAAQ